MLKVRCTRETAVIISIYIAKHKIYENLTIVVKYVIERKEFKQAKQDDNTVVMES
jgi:hypothetical protein